MVAVALHGVFRHTHAAIAHKDQPGRIIGKLRLLHRKGEPERTIHAQNRRARLADDSDLTIAVHQQVGYSPDPQPALQGGSFLLKAEQLPALRVQAAQHPALPVFRFVRLPVPVLLVETFRQSVRRIG